MQIGTMTGNASHCVQFPGLAPNLHNDNPGWTLQVHVVEDCQPPNSAVFPVPLLIRLPRLNFVHHHSEPGYPVPDHENPLRSLDLAHSVPVLVAVNPRSLD
jgi:hypothetical protein